MIIAFPKYEICNLAECPVGSLVRSMENDSDGALGLKVGFPDNNGQGIVSLTPGVPELATFDTIDNIKVMKYAGQPLWEIDTSENHVLASSRVSYVPGSIVLLADAPFLRVSIGGQIGRVAQGEVNLNSGVIVRGTHFQRALIFGTWSIRLLTGSKDEPSIPMCRQRVDLSDASNNPH